jgi:hypothetical protein
MEGAAVRQWRRFPRDLRPLRHTLGNLTSTAWNSKLSNLLFEHKQEILSTSKLKLDEALANATQ